MWDALKKPFGRLEHCTLEIQWNKQCLVRSNRSNHFTSIALARHKRSLFLNVCTCRIWKNWRYQSNWNNTFLFSHLPSDTCHHWRGRKRQKSLRPRQITSLQHHHHHFYVIIRKEHVWLCPTLHSLLIYFLWKLLNQDGRQNKGACGNKSTSASETKASFRCREWILAANSVLEWMSVGCKCVTEWTRERNIKNNNNSNNSNCTRTLNLLDLLGNDESSKPVLLFNRLQNIVIWSNLAIWFCICSVNMVTCCVQGHQQYRYKYLVLYLYTYHVLRTV